MKQIKKVLDILKKVNAKYQNIEYDMDIKFIDLGMDSLEFIKFLVLIEEEFCIEIDDEYLDKEKISTLGELMKIINDSRVIGNEGY